MLHTLNTLEDNIKSHMLMRCCENGMNYSGGRDKTFA